MWSKSFLWSGSSSDKFYCLEASSPSKPSFWGSPHHPNLWLKLSTPLPKPCPNFLLKLLPWPFPPLLLFFGFIGQWFKAWNPWWILHRSLTFFSSLLILVSHIFCSLLGGFLVGVFLWCFFSIISYRVCENCSLQVLWNVLNSSDFFSISVRGSLFPGRRLIYLQIISILLLRDMVFWHLTILDWELKNFLMCTDCTPVTSFVMVCP